MTIRWLYTVAPTAPQCNDRKLTFVPWQIPNSNLFDQLGDGYHPEDCGHRLRKYLRSPGFRRFECSLDDHGTANIQFRTYITKSTGSMDKAINKATCGAFEKFPKCFQHDHYY